MNVFSLLEETGCNFADHLGLLSFTEYERINAQKLPCPLDMGLRRPVTTRIDEDTFGSTSIYLVAPDFTTVVTPRVLVNDVRLSEGRLVGLYFTDKTWYEYTFIVQRNVVRYMTEMVQNQFTLYDIGNLSRDEMAERYLCALTLVSKIKKGFVYVN